MDAGNLSLASADLADLQDTVFMALELSRKSWLVAFFAPRLGDRVSVHTVPGGDGARLLALIDKVKSKVTLKGGTGLRTVCCYEAGYDGFWIHRLLVQHGVENHVLDGASIPIDRRAKHVKTDNVDVRRLLKAVIGHVRGDPESCRVVRVPTPEEEDERRLHRERQRLVRERTGHLNRIKALLIVHGIRALRITDTTWCNRLDKLRTGDGRCVPERLKTEISRE